MELNKIREFLLFKRYLHYVKDQYGCFIKLSGITWSAELVNKYDIYLMEGNSVLLSNNTTS